MRQIVLDTETTGLSVSDGHKLIEIGCIEIINRKITDNNFHVYINPKRVIDPGAVAVHGITNDFLKDKPTFSQVVEDFLNFVGNDELIIHNARFDLSFLNYEIQQIREKHHNLEDKNSVIDTLKIARNLYPGQRNSLDALCKRLGVDNKNRKLHGALLDAELLAKVYLEMTAGQIQMQFERTFSKNEFKINSKTRSKSIFNEIEFIVENNEIQAHLDYLSYMEQKSKVKPIWLDMEQDAHA